MSDACDRAFEPGQVIVTGQGGGFPRALAARLKGLGSRLAGSSLTFGIPDPALLGLAGVRLKTFFPAGALGNAERFAGAGAEYWRLPLSAFARELSRPGAVDLALVRVSPPRGGYRSVAFNADYILPVARTARRLLLEECPDAPWLGAHIAADDPRIAAVIAGPPGLAAPPAAAADGPLAAQLRAVLPPLLARAGAIQVGMGSWTLGVGEALKGGRIAVHSGLADTWLAAALQADPQSISTVTVGAVAAQPDICRLAEALLAEGRFALKGATETHDPAVLDALGGLVAVNSVWQVDLSGQGNCEWLPAPQGGMTRGGIGGLPDFAAAASRHGRGCSVLCLRSEDAAGRSRIVPRLEGEAVSLAADQVDLVLTEIGAARLRGLVPAARADAILRVAGPAYDREFGGLER